MDLFFSVDENLITLLSYILLFSTDFAEEGVDQNEIVNSPMEILEAIKCHHKNSKNLKFYRK